MTVPITESDATRQLLTAADALFYRRGIGAVTMAEVRDRSGVSFRRMYALFATKADLVAAWLDRRHESWIDWFRHEIDAGEDDGRSTVDAIFDAIAGWMRSTDYRGCGFVNTLAETGELTDAHRELIRRHKRELLDLLAGRTSDGAALAVLVDGAIVQSAVFRSTRPVDAARRAAATLLDEPRRSRTSKGAARRSDEHTDGLTDEQHLGEVVDHVGRKTGVQ